MQTDRELKANASRWRLAVGMMVMNLRLQRPGQLRAQMPVCGMWQVINAGESTWEEQGALVPLAEWDGVVAAAGEQSGAPKQKPRKVVRSGAWLGALRETSLEECPVGLFVCSGELCFKSEYSTDGRPDAYIVASGEYFWGGTDEPAEARRLRVTPLEGRWAPNEKADRL